MIILHYDQWFKLTNRLHNDYVYYLYNINGLLRTEFQAQVRPLPEKYMLTFEMTFDNPKQETVFKLKYSEYL